MIQTPVIVTFANQKGGVGKTTLCITFANYLVTKGARVVVIDCDFQHSIMKCRKADIRKYGEQEMPYEVWAYEANDKAMMTSLMEKLHNDPEIDVVLMDSPGSLKAEGLIPMFVNSDIIIVPFHYDLVTVPSTASFLMFVDRLKKAVGERMKARLFIIPNLKIALSGRCQISGIRLMQHIIAVLPILYPQAKSKPGITPDIIIYRSTRFLCRQNQMQAKTAPDLRHTDQLPHKIRFLPFQLGKLINN